MKSFFLGEHEIGQPARPFLVAEVGQAHDGSLGMAHSYIELAQQIGVDAIKFQTHIADAESTYDEQFRVNFSYVDQTRYDYWKRMEFTREQWFGLKKHAEVAGLVFLSTPFSLEAVDLLRSMDVPAWKVGSGDLINHEMLAYMAKDRKPALLSTGMAMDNEIERAVRFLEEQSCPYAIFQCTSKYPTPLEDVGLNCLDNLRRKFDVPVGLSDHSGEIYPALLAMARGANLVELHITFHKGSFGPDSVASLTPEQFREVVRARDAFRIMDEHPVSKDDTAGQLENMRYLFTRSLSLRQDRQAGHVIDEADLVLKKPGGGLAETEKKRLVGMRLKHDVPSRRLLREDDLEENVQQIRISG